MEQVAEVVASLGIPRNAFGNEKLDEFHRIAVVVEGRYVRQGHVIA